LIVQSKNFTGVVFAYLIGESSISVRTTFRIQLLCDRASTSGSCALILDRPLA
jgi:hypothetical protein